MSIIYV